MITFCNIANTNPHVKRQCHGNTNGIYLIFAFCKYKMTLCVGRVPPACTDLLIFLNLLLYFLP